MSKVHIAEDNFFQRFSYEINAMSTWQDHRAQTHTKIVKLILTQSPRVEDTQTISWSFLVLSVYY